MATGDHRKVFLSVVDLDSRIRIMLPNPDPDSNFVPRIRILTLVVGFLLQMKLAKPTCTNNFTNLQVR